MVEQEVARKEAAVKEVKWAGSVARPQFPTHMSGTHHSKSAALIASPVVAAPAHTTAAVGQLAETREGERNDSPSIWKRRRARRVCEQCV